MPERLAITVFPDGPLKLSNARKLTYCGEDQAVEGDVFLCRCGQSANAPFCDGSHKRVGFVGTNEEPPTKDVQSWEGNTLRTFFNPNTCMHVLACKPLKELRERELNGDVEAAEEIIRVIAKCPSGALSYETKQYLETPTEVSADADVAIMEGGEIRVQCTFTIDTELNERQRNDRATLCRCGLSKNKPWCDGRHTQRSDFR